MNKIALLAVCAVLGLAGCKLKPTPVKVVAAIGDCTESTGGWSGERGKCRVTFEDGTRGTAQRPVDIGDRLISIAGVYSPTDRQAP